VGDDSLTGLHVREGGVAWLRLHVFARPPGVVMAIADKAGSTALNEHGHSQFTLTHKDSTGRGSSKRLNDDRWFKLS
jgi:hypothetical protein